MDMKKEQEQHEESLYLKSNNTNHINGGGLFSLPANPTNPANPNTNLFSQSKSLQETSVNATKPTTTTTTTTTTAHNYMDKQDHIELERKLSMISMNGN